MLKSEARTAIKSAYEDVGGAPSDTELNVWIDLEQKRLRRDLASAVPSLYTATDSEQTIANGTETLTKPSDYERLVRLERKCGVTWEPVRISDAISPQLDCLNVREEGTALKIGPALYSQGTYRIVYVQKPASIVSANSPDETLAVPEGCEDVILARCEARARVKLQEDPSPHLSRATEVWIEQKKALKKRYGRLPEPGLRQVRDW